MLDGHLVAAFQVEHGERGERGQGPHPLIGQLGVKSDTFEVKKMVVSQVEAGESGKRGKHPQPLVSYVGVAGVEVGESF